MFHSCPFKRTKVSGPLPLIRFRGTNPVRSTGFGISRLRFCADTCEYVRTSRCPEPACRSPGRSAHRWNKGREGKRHGGFRPGRVARRQQLHHRQRRPRHGDVPRRRALERSTRDAYARAARAFDDWLGGARETDAALAHYLGVLFDRGLAAASAETVVAALKDRARRTGAACPAGERTRQTLCGYRRAGAGRGLGQVDGLSWEQTDRMAGLAEQRGTGGLRDALPARRWWT